MEAREIGVEFEEFHEFLELHHQMKNASDKCIRKIIESLIPHPTILRTLLLTYLQFFFTESNRIQQLKNDAFDHQAIISQSHYFLNTKRRIKNRNKAREYLGNICSILPTELLSHIISFLNQAQRYNVSKLNEIFLNAASQNKTKYHLCINKGFVKKRLIDTNIPQHIISHHSVTWNRSYRCQSTPTNEKWQNFQKNMSKILSSESLNSVSINTGKQHQKDIIASLENIAVNNHNVTKLNLSPMREYNGTLHIDEGNIHRLTHIESGMNNMVSLWMKHGNKYYNNHDNIDDIDNNYLYDNHRMNGIHSNGMDIEQYLIETSNIKHITFHFYEGYEHCYPYGIIPHPIFWLWNIPKLESCTLRVPINSDTEFKRYCEQMSSSSSVVRKRAKQQRSFKKLSVLFDSQRFKSISVFVQCIRSLYPNLKIIEIYQLYPFIGTVTKVDIKWKSLFKNLKEIKLELPTIKYGASFVKKIVDSRDSFESLEVLHLLKMRPECSDDNEIDDDDDDEEEDDDEEDDDDDDDDDDEDEDEDMKENEVHEENKGEESGYIISSINDLVLKVCNLIENRPKKLYSLNIDIEDKCLHKSLKETYFKPYNLLLNTLLKMVRNDKNIFDGYLRLNVPLNGKILVPSTKYKNKRFWYRGKHEWDDDNVAESFKLTRIICKLQNKIKALNERKRKFHSKLALDIRGLGLEKKHRQFLLFCCNATEESDRKKNNGHLYVML